MYDGKLFSCHRGYLLGGSLGAGEEWRDMLITGNIAGIMENMVEVCDVRCSLCWVSLIVCQRF